MRPPARDINGMTLREIGEHVELRYDCEVVTRLQIQTLARDIHRIRVAHARTVQDVRRLERYAESYGLLVRLTAGLTHLARKLRRLRP